MNYPTLPIESDAPEVVNAVVEGPRAQSSKYEYDKSLQVFCLDRPLFASVHYPCEYGFIPGTLGGGGDALDILILADQPSFTGCVVETRPVGLLDMVDQGGPDQKILTVLARDPEPKEIRNRADVFPHLLREIEHFFSVYMQLEGKHTEVAGGRDVTQARGVINERRRRFEKRQKPA